MLTLHEILYNMGDDIRVKVTFTDDTIKPTQFKDGVRTTNVQILEGKKKDVFSELLRTSREDSDKRLGYLASVDEIVDDTVIISAWLAQHNNRYIVHYIKGLDEKIYSEEIYAVNLNMAYMKAESMLEDKQKNFMSPIILHGVKLVNGIG